VDKSFNTPNVREPTYASDVQRCASYFRKTLFKGIMQYPSQTYVVQNCQKGNLLRSASHGHTSSILLGKQFAVPCAHQQMRPPGAEVLHFRTLIENTSKPRTSFTVVINPNAF